MTRKSFLKMWLPVILTIVLIIALVFGFTSCSKQKDTPYGNLKDDEYYIDIQLSSDKSYKLSEKELYDYVKIQNGVNPLVQMMDKVIYADEITAINAKLSDVKEMLIGGVAESSDDETQLYYDFFNTAINTDCYGETFEEFLEKASAEVIATAELRFLDSLFSSGVAVTYTATDTNIYQDAVFEHYTLAVAKKLNLYNEKKDEIYGANCYGGNGSFGQSYCSTDVTFADLADEDGNGVPDTIDSEYTTNYDGKGSIGAIAINFANENEYIETIKMFRLGVYSSKWYSLPAFSSETASDYGNPIKEREWYNTQVSNISSSRNEDDGAKALSDAEVFAYYLLMYNYINDYRTDIATDIINDLIADGNVTGVATDVVYTIDEIAELIYYGDAKGTAIVNALAASDIADEVTGANLAEGEKDLFAYTLLKAYEQNNEFTYDYDGFSNSIVRSYVYTTLKAFGVDNDDYSSSALRASITSRSSSGSDASSTTRFIAYKLTESNDVAIDGALYDEIFDALINAQVTTDTITAAVSAKYTELFNNGKVEIYDPLVEQLFAISYADYKKTGATSTNAVAKINDKEISVDTYAEKLIDIYGLGAVTSITLGEYLKNDSYYTSQVTDEELNAVYENQINYFSSDAYAANGFPASIGKEAFVRLFFNATNREDAIQNSILPNQLKSLYFADFDKHYTDAEGNPTIYEKFAQFTENSYDEFASLTFRNLLIYVDSNDDGTPDNPREYYTETELTSMNTLVNNLASNIKTRVENATGLTEDAAIEAIVAEYNSFSRFVSTSYKATIDSLPTTMTDWSEYKKAGLRLKYEASNSSVTGYVKEFQQRLEDVYAGDILHVVWENNEFIPFFDTETTATDFGWHLILFTAGAKAQSAKFTAANDSQSVYANAVYNYDLDNNKDNGYEKTITVDNAYNDNDSPSANQIELYIRDANYNKQTNVYLPTAATYPVYETVQTFFDPIKTRYTSSFYQVILTLKYLNDHDVDYSSKFTSLNQSVDVLKRQIDEYVDYSADGIYKDWWTVFAF